MKIFNRFSLGITIACIACLVFTPGKAQVKDSCTYPVVVKFASIGMGVPSDSLLRNYINSFRKKNKVKKITACRIGPMGKEGEYWLAFSLAELTKKQAADFKSELKPVTEKMTDRGQTYFEENVMITKADLSGRVSVKETVFE